MVAVHNNTEANKRAAQSLEKSTTKKESKRDDGYSFALLLSALDGFRLIQEKMGQTDDKLLQVNGSEKLKQANFLQDFQYQTQLTGKVTGSAGEERLENFNAHNQEITAERAIPQSKIQNYDQQAQVLESDVSATVNSAVQTLQEESATLNMAGQLAQQIAQI